MLRIFQESFETKSTSFAKNHKAQTKFIGSYEKQCISRMEIVF